MLVIRWYILYPLYRVYAQLDGWLRNDDSPLPAIPCQICGQVGHVETLCSEVKSLGFYDE